MKILMSSFHTAYPIKGEGCLFTGPMLGDSPAAKTAGNPDSPASFLHPIFSLQFH